MAARKDECLPAEESVTVQTRLGRNEQDEQGQAQQLEWQEEEEVKSNPSTSFDTASII